MQRRDTTRIQNKDVQQKQNMSNCTSMLAFSLRAMQCQKYHFYHDHSTGSMTFIKTQLQLLLFPCRKFIPVHLVICNHLLVPWIFCLRCPGFQCKHVSSRDLNWMVFNATGFLCIWTGWVFQQWGPVTASLRNTAMKWLPPCLLVRHCTLQKYYCSSSRTTSC